MATAAAGTSRFQALARVRSKRHKKATVDDKITFFEQLSILLDSGTPLLGALQISAAQTESDHLRDALRIVASQVASGRSFAEAAAAHPKAFEPQWIEVLRVGELSGQLSFVLRELNDTIRNAKQIRSDVIGALTYPAVLGGISVLCVVVMLWKVVPTFAEFFQDMGGELPLITQWVVGLSEFLQANGFKMIGGTIVGVFLLRRYVRTPNGRNVKDVLLIATPVVGDLVIQTAMEKFTSNLSLLLRSGMPLLEALRAVREMFNNNAVYAGALKSVNARVARGSSLADALTQTLLYTDLVISMVRIGEQSGTLPESLAHIAKFYRERVKVQVERVTGLMEPLIVVGMGVVVAVILASVYLPMFQASSGPG